MAVAVAVSIAEALATLFAGTEIGIALSNLSKSSKSNSNESLFEQHIERQWKITEGLEKDAENIKLKDIEKGRQKAQEQRKESKAEELKEKKQKPTPPILPIGGTGTTTETASGNTNVTDQTQAGIESMINGNSLLEFMQAQQQRQWDREDKIRQEEYARQDTAYQRTIKDMQAAGINPNLMNVTPTDSTVGTVSSAGLDYTVFEESMKGLLLEVEKEIEHEFKGDENSKDRATKIATTLISLMIAKFVMKK